MATYYNCDPGGDGMPAARVGDTTSCPIHGDGTISSGSNDTFINGRSAARIGDTISCGATITEGSDNVFTNGLPAAFLGCGTSHGGKITSGSPDTFIGTTKADTESKGKSFVYDQHLVFEDQDGQALDGLPYKLTSPRGEVMNGTTGADGKTTIVDGNDGEILSCVFAVEEET